ncbi:hypothetical protein ACVWXO_011066 [Bradyrhizobium sp. LM2.7]
MSAQQLWGPRHARIQARMVTVEAFARDELIDCACDRTSGCIIAVQGTSQFCWCGATMSLFLASNLLLQPARIQALDGISLMQATRVVLALFAQNSLCLFAFGFVRLSPLK